MEIIAPAGRKIELPNTCASELIRTTDFQKHFKKKWSSHNIQNEYFRGEIRLIAHPCLSASACAGVCLHELLSQLFPFSTYCKALTLHLNNDHFKKVGLIKINEYNE